MAPRKCRGCGGLIPHARPRLALYCDNDCRRDADRQRYRMANPTPRLSPGITGARHELLVCADLIGRGFEVFRAVAPHGCDLAILQDKRLYRVEVTTGHIYTTQKGRRSLYHPQKNFDKFDVLALVLLDGTIEYLPQLPTSPQKRAVRPPTAPNPRDSASRQP